MSEDVGQAMHAFISRLYPICRSITGDGTRETLRLIKERIPLQVEEVPSGTQVFDWVVPNEWNIRDAWVKDASGRRLIDFQQHNLHVVSYSTPIRRKMAFTELQGHLFTSAADPSWIPYRTSYYDENWGFCLSHHELEDFDFAAEYEVMIDSSLEEGSLSYGEYFLAGDTSDEVLFSCHVCHPSLANDNLSGIAVAVELAQELARTNRRYSYRFLFVPGTIGAIAWLARNQETWSRIRHGLVLTCLGDNGNMTYKRSRQGNAGIDRAVTHVLRDSGDPHQVVDFSPYGYDERQYGSPGINLSVGCLMRSSHGAFPEYHTSADNLTFVRPAALADSLAKCLAVIEVLENNRSYLNQAPMGEPQLGRRGLYRGMEGERAQAMLWVLNLSDGNHSLLDIAERAALPFALVREAANRLLGGKLLAQL